MTKKIHSLILILLYFALPGGLTAQFSIQLTKVPANTPMSDPIYIAGNFNNWNEKDDNYKLTNQNDGTYTITFNPAPGQLEFKFTRGSWDSVEGNDNGGFRPNREYNYAGGVANLDLDILSWEDLGGPGGGSTTAADNVFVLDEDFYIPQFDRNRKIWIYLPPDYATSNKRYSVIYMQDGQNLFDAYTSFSGEWEVDESLNRLFDQGDEGVIVVGIAHGGAKRVDEYSPWQHPIYGGGEGSSYAQFVAKILKPYVDQNYRTNPGREHTGIMGSSMGGLVSMYAAIEYQEVFGKAGIFSPSFWFSSQAYTHVSTTGKNADMRIYLLAGDLEDNGSVVDAIQDMRDTLLAAGFSDSEIIVDTDADGQHSEWYWRREFPDAYLWLCAILSTATENIPSQIEVLLYPNPADSMIHIHLKEDLNNGSYQLYNASGQLLLNRTFRNRWAYITTSNLSRGIYFLKFFENGKQVGVKKIVLEN